MRRSRRSAGVGDCSPAAQIGRHKHRCVMNTQPNSRSCPPKTDDQPDTLLEHCFDAMLPNIWYKILPNTTSDVNTIAFAMGQTWLLLVHLLMSLGYLKSYKIPLN